MHLVNILIATLSMGLPAALAQRVFPEPISILNTTYGGTGCPANSLTSAFDSSLPSLQFKATRYDVRLGKDISVVQNRKNCQIRTEILVPANYSITIWKSVVSGTAKLSEEVAARFMATIYLSGDASQTAFQSMLKGPLNAPFTKAEETSFETVWTPCGGGVIAFNFNTQLRLSLLNQTASNAAGEMEPILLQNYDFTWRKC